MYVVNVCACCVCTECLHRKWEAFRDLDKWRGYERIDELLKKTFMILPKLDRKKCVRVKKYAIYLMLVGVMVAWGLNVIATKVLVSNFMPVTMTAFRIMTAALSVFLLLIPMRQLRLLRGKEWGYVLVASLFNVVGHHYFLSLGLANTSASNGGLILGLGPLLTTLMAILFLGTRMTWFNMTGIVLGLSGVAFIVTHGSSGMSGVSIGDVYVFLAILAQAISFILIKKMSATLDPRLMTGYMLFFGSFGLYALSLVLEPEGMASMAQTDIGLWAVFLGSAVIATAVGHMTYNYAIGQVGAAEASIFINLNPFFALIGSSLLLGEAVTIVQMSGFVLILIGVLFGSGALEEWLRQHRLRKGDHRGYRAPESKGCSSGS